MPLSDRARWVRSQYLINLLLRFLKQLYFKAFGANLELIQPNNIFYIILKSKEQSSSSSSSSSCRTISTDISDPLSPPLLYRQLLLAGPSGLHPVSAQSCCMYVRAGRPAFVRPCRGVHRTTSVTSSFLLLQQYPVCLVRLILIVFEMGCRWPYSCCFVECCL